MERRTLLQAIAAIPLWPGVMRHSETLKSLHGTTTKTAVMESGVAAIPAGHYMVFVDMEAIDVGQLAQMECPPGITMDIVPVHCRSGRTIDDSVRIFSIEDPGAKENS